MFTLASSKRAASLIALSLAALPHPALSATESILYTFSGIKGGIFPYSPLIKVGDKFYGTTNEGGTKDQGTVFSVAKDGRHKVLYSFLGSSDGARPLGGLVDVGGTLYGTTETGGGGCSTNGCGTVYAITPQGSYHTVYAFQGGADGALSNATLINIGGTLYGTTQGGGGACNCGTVFSVTPGGAEQVLYAFKGGPDGADPIAGLTTDGTTLYGTTVEGGGTACHGTGCGTVFAVNLQGAETVLYAFPNRDQGEYPYGSLLKLGNSLYGTTNAGGTANDGTVYRVDLSGSHKVLHTFTGVDGFTPWSGLINGGSTLYGAVSGGAGTGAGAIYSITRQGAFSLVYSFQGGADGGGPIGNLIDISGTLYGATAYGGYGRDCGGGCGTIFSITP